MAAMSEPITLQQLQNELAQTTELFIQQMRRILQEELDLGGSPKRQPPQSSKETISHATHRWRSANQLDPTRRFFSSDPHSDRKDDVSGDANEQGPGHPVRKQQDARDYMLGYSHESIEMDGTAEHRDFCETWLHGRNFQKVMAIVVILNVLVTGLQIDSESQQIAGPEEWKICNTLFAFVFVIEIILRLAINKWAFFYSENRYMNVLDLVLVLVQCAEWAFARSSVTDVQTIRLFRLLRLARLARLFVIFDPMLAVLSALLNSVQALAWTLVVLLVTVYMVSVSLLHMIIHVEATDEPVVKMWFSNILHTMLSLIECIAGGVSWDIIIRPLFLHVSPWVGAGALIYIIAGVLFMLNLITGIFVDQVIRGAVEDRDRLMVERITEHFLDEDGNGELSLREEQRQIDIDEFTTKLQHPVMQEYFSKIDVRPSHRCAQTLFELLDADGSGSISAEEVIWGCLALRGSAKGLDAQILMREVGNLLDAVKQIQPNDAGYDII